MHVTNHFHKSKKTVERFEMLFYNWQLIDIDLSLNVLVVTTKLVHN